MKPALFTDMAQADVEEAFQWYEAQRPGLGAAFRPALDVDESILIIACIHAKRHPRAWRSR